MQAGLEEYLSGAQALSDSAARLSAGMAQLDQNGAELSAGYAQMAQGTLQLLDILKGMQGVLTEQQKAQVTMMEQSLADFETGLDSYVAGVGDTVQGAAALSGGLQSLTQGNTALRGGAESVSDGLAGISGGPFPGQRPKRPCCRPRYRSWSTGSRPSATGIEEAIGYFDDSLGTDSGLTPVSFADPARSVNSVQFVMKTQAILPQADESTSQAETGQREHLGPAGGPFQLITRNQKPCVTLLQTGRVNRYMLKA